MAYEEDMRCIQCFVNGFSSCALAPTTAGGFLSLPPERTRRARPFKIPLSTVATVPPV